MQMSWLPLIASAFLAVIPVIIWIRFIQKESEEKMIYVKTFLFGTLSVVPPFILIFVFEAWPSLNIYSLINRSVEQVALAALLTNIVVGIIEEIAKNLIVRIIDKRHPEYIQTIGSALKLSICAGLGFSFAENIFYFYNIWTNPAFGATDLFAAFIFRSLFTMMGHMLFSGIFGYFFAIGKFSADITEVEKWEGKKFYFTRLVSKLTGKMTFQVVREIKNLQGLLIAMSMHAVYNASLDLQQKIPSILIVAGGAIYIYYLLKTTAGHLLFSVTKRRQSDMAQRDEDVVIELLGMWMNEGKLTDVIQICDRLLKRDPDNNVVKLFRAKASDNAKLKQFYTSLKVVLGKTQPALEQAAAVSSAAPAAGATPETAQPQTPGIGTSDEKVVLEAMDMWYKEGNYKQVLEVSNRLLARNPQSNGAKLLMQKALDKEKLQKMYDSLSMLFKE